MSPTIELVIYGRPGCHLCDDALLALEQITAGLDGVGITEIDIESDEDLLRRYLEKIPVIAIGGQVITELESEAGPLRLKLAASGLVKPLREGYSGG